MNEERVNDLSARITQFRPDPVASSGSASSASSEDWETPVPLSRLSLRVLAQHLRMVLQRELDTLEGLFDVLGHGAEITSLHVG